MKPRILAAHAFALIVFLTGAIAYAAYDTDLDDDLDTDGVDIAIARNCFLTQSSQCILDAPVIYHEVNGDSRWNTVDIGIVRNAAFKPPATPTPTRTPAPGGCNGDAITEDVEAQFYMMVNAYRLNGDLPLPISPDVTANDWTAPLPTLAVRPALVKAADMSTHINEARGFIGHDQFGAIITACMDRSKWHGENQVGHECSANVIFYAFYLSRGVGTDYKHSGIMRDGFWKGIGADIEPNYDGVPSGVACWSTVYLESP